MQIIYNIFIFLIFITFISSIYEDEPHPVPEKNIDYICSICHVLKIGKDKEYRCVKRNRCCNGLNSYVSCLLNPCLNYKKSCKRAKYCKINNCRSTGCYAIYYDKNWIEIDTQYCNTNDTLKIKEYQIPQEMKNRNRVEIFPKVTMKTFYHDPKVKPGICDKEFQNKGELLKVCTDNCKHDNDCTGREKCCNNGCANLCTVKYKKIYQNFLNFQIYTHITKPKTDN
uniref:WAP domain-containing protein n=1 Tax=Parastrongyloides trichosuri TaxID=131310 RepID=A0A0N4ZK80_PARTI